MNSILVAILLSADPLPPQYTPVNLTQVKGQAIGPSNAVPVSCVSGCGGGGSGGGAVDQGSPGPTDGGWPVVLVDQDGNPFGTGANPVFISGGGGGGGASWDAGVIVQYPVAVASLWDGGVYVLNFPAVQAVSQEGPWVVDLDPDAGPLQVACVSGCGGGSGGGGSSWDAGVLVQNDVTVLQGSAWDVTGSTVAVVQDTSPWAISGAVTQGGNWAELMVYDGGALPISGSVTISAPIAITGTVGVTQSGNWSVLIEYDAGPLPVSGTVSVSNLPSVQAVSLVDGGSPIWDAGFLAYTYAGPLPADTSYQTSCTTAVTFCGTTSTAFPACAGGKWQDFQNQSSQSIYICAQAGCSAPTAIDAGTVVGEQVQSFATYFANGSAQYWCVVPTSPQNSPDAGTVTKCCK